jgi:hypothetical protein
MTETNLTGGGREGFMKIKILDYLYVIWVFLAHKLEQFLLYFSPKEEEAKKGPAQRLFLKIYIFSSSEEG